MSDEMTGNYWVVQRIRCGSRILGKRAGALALHNSSCTWSISKMFYKY
jgi:hypothetical protein